MLLDDKPYTLDRIVRLGIVAALVWAAVWLLGYLSDVLIPFALAFLLAYLINPLVTLVQRGVRSRVAAVGLSLVIVTVVVLTVGTVLVYILVGEIQRMGELLAALVRDSETARRARDMLPPDLWQSFREFAAREDVQEFFRSGDFWSGAESVAQRVLPGLWGMVRGTVSFLFVALLGIAAVALYLAFLLVDYQHIRKGWRRLVPPKYRQPTLLFAGDVHAAMRRYFRAQAGVAAIVGVLFAAGFAIIGLPLGVLLGLLVGLLNMVPYLQNVALVPAAFLALLHSLETGTNFWLVLLAVAAVFIVVQAIQDIVLVPRDRKSVV